MAAFINRVGVSSLAPRTKIVVEPSETGDGTWYWAFLVDGETYSDGEEEEKARANSKAVVAYEEWAEKQ